MSGPRDIVREHPVILFVGINPGRTSGRVGHHFAGPGNPFWKLLAASGLTTRELAAAEDQSLVDHGHALVNLCTRTTRTAAELTTEERVRGKQRLLGIIDTLEPRVVALVGVTLYPIIVGAAAAKASPGPGPKPERPGGARLFVVPNPSGLNASFPTFAAKLRWFEELRAFAYGQRRRSRT